MEAAGGLLAFAFGLIVMAGATHAVQKTVTNGTQGRNPAVGIRTKITQSSDLAWKVGHEAAAPWMWATSVTGYSTGVLTLVIAAVQMILDANTSITLVVPAAGFVGGVAFSLIGTRKANEAGRSIIDEGS